MPGMSASTGKGPSAAQIAQHLQRLRESAGLSIPELAERAELGVDRVVMLESGAVEPDMDELTRYAAGLGYQLSVLFRLWERGLN